MIFVKTIQLWTIPIIENEIKEAFNRDPYLILVSLGLKKAFDTIWRYRLIKFMKQLNLNENIILS